MSETTNAFDIRTILVPIDFSPGSAKALDTAANLAKRLGSKLVLLHALHVDVPTTAFLIPGGPLLPPDFHQALRDNAKAGIEQVTEQAKSWGVEASGVVVEGPPAAVVVEQAEKLGADLIAIGTRGNSGLKSLVLGSVATRVLQTAPCPVLTVREDDE